MGKYQLFEPGKYLEWEQKMVEEKMEAAQKGPPGGRSKPEVIKADDILRYNRKWNPYDPLYNNTDYAKKAGYRDILAWPNFKAPLGAINIVSVSLELAKEIGADLWYNGHGPNDNEFFAPIYPGDELTSESESISFEDITLPGSDFRHFRTGCVSNLYNQKGDLVVRAKLWRREAYRKIIDGSEIPSYTDNVQEWMAYFPKAHFTTDEEWEYIKELWAKEKVRGQDTLYWEDVKVGDEPPWTTTGPISCQELARCYGDSLFSVRDIIMRGGQEQLFRDQYGQYFSSIMRHFGGMNIPGARGVLFNNHAAQEITRMVTNYAGDAGFVTRIGWMFQQLYKVMRYPREGGEYLDQVPYMKGKGCTVHGMEGDTVIARGYVTNKYTNDKKEHIIDLVCWAETLDRHIVQVVPAAIRLPSKQK